MADKCGQGAMTGTGVQVHKCIGPWQSEACGRLMQIGGCGRDDLRHKCGTLPLSHRQKCQMGVVYSQTRGSRWGDEAVLRMPQRPTRQGSIGRAPMNRDARGVCEGAGPGLNNHHLVRKKRHDLVVWIQRAAIAEA